MFKSFHVRAGVLLISSLLLASAVARAGGECDRQCLKSLMDQYLSALIAHNPSRLPVTRDVKFTENTNRLTLGDGLWQTVDGLGTFRFYIEDPASSQAAFYGTVKENGVTALLSVRLKERGRRISELETIVVRQATGIHGSFDRLDRLDPAWEEAVPPDERSSRQELIHDANQYFEGIVRGNGDIVPFAEDCTRVENGAQTAPLPATATRPAMNVRDSFNSKRFNYIHEITNRRFLVVDSEHGLVVAWVMFQHPGNIRTPAGAGESGAPTRRFSLASYPNTTQIMETFQVRGGKIRRIFAYIGLVPYRQSPGW